MSKVKDHHSDGEGDETPEDKKGNKLTPYQQEIADLENAPVIPDSEISPAAFIFSQTEEEQQQILFEEKS
jgi:hypothetical protein